MLQHGVVAEFGGRAQRERGRQGAVGLAHGLAELRPHPDEVRAFVVRRQRAGHDRVAEEMMLPARMSWPPGQPVMVGGRALEGVVVEPTDGRPPPELVGGERWAVA